MNVPPTIDIPSAFAYHPDTRKQLQTSYNVLAQEVKAHPCETHFNNLREVARVLGKTTDCDAIIGSVGPSNPESTPSAGGISPEQHLTETFKKVINTEGAGTGMEVK